VVARCKPSSNKSLWRNAFMTSIWNSVQSILDAREIITQIEEILSLGEKVSL
jgi:hypothetical protein